MAREFAEHDCQFVFVYTREAHPSDRYPGHSSLEQKIAVAHTMAERLGFERPMLVDDLEGTLHHAYGRLPNMTYIIDPAGTILYRAAWTDPRTIRLALEQVLFEREQRRTRRRVTPYYMEWIPKRLNDDIRFVTDLYELGGARPVEEYIAAMEHIEGEAATKNIRAWWSQKKTDA